MKIQYTSLFVDDLAAAERFYTEVLGFQVKSDVPLGEGVRWLTVVSPQDPDGPEIVLEPSGHPAVAPFKAALMADGIPFNMFVVEDLDAELARLRAQDVRVVQDRLDAGPVVIAVIDDGFGNLLQLAEPKPVEAAAPTA